MINWTSKDKKRHRQAIADMLSVTEITAKQDPRTAERLEEWRRHLDDPMRRLNRQKEWLERRNGAGDH